MEGRVQSALADVRREFAAQGYEATLEVTPDPETTISGHRLTVTIPDHRDFQYHAQAVEARVPKFSGRGSMSQSTDTYYRVEVFAQTGSEGYDLYGLTRQQVIDDVLDRYEAHLGFLVYSQEHDYASVLTPVTTATGTISQVSPEDPTGTDAPTDSPTHPETEPEKTTEEVFEDVDRIREHLDGGEGTGSTGGAGGEPTDRWGAPPPGPAPGTPHGTGTTERAPASGGRLTVRGR